MRGFSSSACRPSAEVDQEALPRCSLSETSPQVSARYTTRHPLQLHEYNFMREFSAYPEASDRGSMDSKHCHHDTLHAVSSRLHTFIQSNVLIADLILSPVLSLSLRSQERPASSIDSPRTNSRRSMRQQSVSNVHSVSTRSIASLQSLYSVKALLV